MVTTKLTVPDISCGHCERTVLESLCPISGVEQVNVDIPTKVVTVAYDPLRVNIDQLRDALAAEDYPVESAEEVSV